MYRLSFIDKVNGKFVSEKINSVLFRHPKNKNSVPSVFYFIVCMSLKCLFNDIVSFPFVKQVEPISKTIKLQLLQPIGSEKREILQ